MGWGGGGPTTKSLYWNALELYICALLQNTLVLKAAGWGGGDPTTKSLYWDALELYIHALLQSIVVL